MKIRDKSLFFKQYCILVIQEISLFFLRVDYYHTSQSVLKVGNTLNIKRKKRKNLRNIETVVQQRLI